MVQPPRETMPTVLCISHEANQKSLIETRLKRAHTIQIQQSTRDACNSTQHGLTRTAEATHHFFENSKRNERTETEQFRNENGRNEAGHYVFDFRTARKTKNEGTKHAPRKRVEGAAAFRHGWFVKVRGPADRATFWLQCVWQLLCSTPMTWGV